MSLTAYDHCQLVSYVERYEDTITRGDAKEENRSPSCVLNETYHKCLRSGFKVHLNLLRVCEFHKDCGQCSNGSFLSIQIFPLCQHVMHYTPNAFLTEILSVNLLQVHILQLKATPCS